MRQELVRFEVNGRNYAVRTMAPDRAIGFGMKLAGIIAPVFSAVAFDNAGGFIETLAGVDDVRMTGIIEEARKCLIGIGDDGKDMMMSNPAIFNIWFTEHPEDLFEVSMKSVWFVCRDFFPPALITAVEKVRSKLSAAKQAIS